MGFNPNFTSAKQSQTYGDGSPNGNRKHPDEGYKPHRGYEVRMRGVAAFHWCIRLKKVWRNGV